MRSTILALASLAGLSLQAEASAPAAYGYGPSRPWTASLDLRPHLASSSRLAAAAGASPAGADGFAVQLGAFQALSAAERARRRALHLGPSWIAELRRRGATLHRVRLGPFATRADAEAALAQAHAAGFADAVLAPLR